MGEFMINKIYLLAVGLIIMLCIYIFGIYAGYQKCNAKMVFQTHNQQSQVIEIQRKVNAETFNSGLDDIRDVLYQKYTIKD